MTATEREVEVLTEALWNRGPALSALLERTRQSGKPRADKRVKSRQHQKRLTPAERAEVARRYDADETIGSLATAFGCHRDAIRRSLKRDGVELRQWRSKVAEPARIVELYESGQAAAQIAAEFGVSATAVLNHLRSAGVVLRPRGKVAR